MTSISKAHAQAVFAKGLAEPYIAEGVTDPHELADKITEDLLGMDIIGVDELTRYEEMLAADLQRDLDDPRTAVVYDQEADNG